MEDAGSEQARKLRSGNDLGKERIPAALTDSGCEREFNEDRYSVIEGPSGLAWIVCDGMGGIFGGELAAQLAIDSIRRDLELLPFRKCADALHDAIAEANRVIVLKRQNELFSGMGTTLVGALFQGPEVAIAHIGDSRAYLVREAQAEQLTVDHTFVQDLVSEGKLSLEEALSHPQAHILTRCIGAEPGLEIAVSSYWIWPDKKHEDSLVLASDGLYTLVPDSELANIVSTQIPQQACVTLVELAKSRGGFDNITVAIIPLGGKLQSKPPKGHFERGALPTETLDDGGKGRINSVKRALLPRSRANKTQGFRGVAELLSIGLIALAVIGWFLLGA
jgi:protein phosphatase